MSDGDALLRAILLNPADDTARLVYADWLEDVDGGNDAAHAEFIRWQCESPTRLAPVFVCRCGCNRPNFGLAGNKEGPIPWLERDVAGNIWRSCGPRYDKRNPCADFARGFVSEIRLPLSAFMERAETLFRAHPIERVTLTDRRTYSFVGFYYWSCPDRDSPDALPAELYGRLLPDFPTHNPQSMVGYYTAGAASSNLSDACVAYGRSLAGLPAVPLSAATMPA